jgi:hypothetical protein
MDHEDGDDERLERCHRMAQQRNNVLSKIESKKKSKNQRADYDEKERDRWRCRE